MTLIVRLNNKSFERVLTFAKPVNPMHPATMADLTELHRSPKCVTLLCRLQVNRLIVCSVIPVAKIRVDNLHYDLTEDDLEVYIALLPFSTTH